MVSVFIVNQGLADDLPLVESAPLHRDAWLHRSSAYHPEDLALVGKGILPAVRRARSRRADDGLDVHEGGHRPAYRHGRGVRAVHRAALRAVRGLRRHSPGR